MQHRKKNFRKRPVEEEEGEERENKPKSSHSDDEEERRLALEEVKFLQKQRERKSGIPAVVTAQKSGVGARVGSVVKPVEKSEGDGEKEDLVLQDTFAQETAVMVEDPNM